MHGILWACKPTVLVYCIQLKLKEAKQFAKYFVCAIFRLAGEFKGELVNGSGGGW